MKVKQLDRTTGQWITKCKTLKALSEQFKHSNVNAFEKNTLSIYLASIYKDVSGFKTYVKIPNTVENRKSLQIYLQTEKANMKRYLEMLRYYGGRSIWVELATEICEGFDLSLPFKLIRDKHAVEHKEQNVVVAEHVVVSKLAEWICEQKQVTPEFIIPNKMVDVNSRHKLTTMACVDALNTLIED